MQEIIETSLRSCRYILDEMQQICIIGVYPAQCLDGKDMFPVHHNGEPAICYGPAL